TVHLDGEYRPHPRRSEISHRNDRREIADGGAWYFLWGLVDTGSVDVREGAEEKILHEGDAFMDVEISEHLSLGGALLFLVTIGIVSHHHVVVTSEPAAVRDAPSGTGPSP